MGIYRHPPSPNIGGRQPLESKKLSPSITAVPVNDPPFGQRDNLSPIVISWRADTPPIIVRPRLIQVTIAASDDPPFSQRDYLGLIIQSWEPTTEHIRFPGRIVPEPLVSPDDPPFGSRDTLGLIVQSWEPEPSTRQFPKRFIQEPTIVPDDPPFGLLTSLWPIIRTWQPLPPMPSQLEKLPPFITDVPVDDPPFTQRDPISFLIRSWEPYIHIPALPIRAGWIISVVPKTVIRPRVAGSVLDKIFTGIQLDETDANNVYVGEAQIGSLTSSPVWRIKKLEKVGEITSILYVDGNARFDNVWDDRASLSYS